MSASSLPSATRVAPVATLVRLVLLSLLLSSAASDIGASQTIVTNLDPAAVRTAILGGGLVKLAADGTLNPTRPYQITADTTLDASGHSVVIDAGFQARHFTVSNGATLRLINLGLVNGRVVGSEGQAEGDGEPACGGSIYSSAGNLELIGCRFANNSVLGGDGGPPKAPGPGIGFITRGGAGYGGAIYAAGGQITARDCRFETNNSAGGQGRSSDIYSAPGADAFGGAIACTNARVTLAEVSFTGNSALAGEWRGGRPLGGGGNSWGGAFAGMPGTIVISNCTFTANQAVGATRVASAGGETGSANGGALFHETGELTISQTLFKQNEARGGSGRERGDLPRYARANGGALYLASGKIELRDSSLIGNEAKGGSVEEDCCPLPSFAGDSSGGGLFNRGLTVVINCTLSENRSIGGDGHNAWSAFAGSARGGAIHNEGTISLVNCTFTSNFARPGAGPEPPELSQLTGGAALSILIGAVTVVNTILLCSPGETNILGAVTDAGYNICSDASANFTQVTSRVIPDPMLGTLANNGGPTPTIALLPSSPAIDAGDDSACPATDQRGVARPRGRACDIGAFELAPELNLYVADSGGVTIRHIFRTGITNSVMASTNLINWRLLGYSVSDDEGQIQFEDKDSNQHPQRFYKVRPQTD